MNEESRKPFITANIRVVLQTNKQEGKEKRRYRDIRESARILYLRDKRFVESASKELQRKIDALVREMQMEYEELV